MEPLRLGVPVVVLAGVLGATAPLQAIERVVRFANQPAGRTTGLQGVYLCDAAPSLTTPAEKDGELWFFTKEGRFSRSPRGGFSLQALSEASGARSNEGVYWIEKDRLKLAMVGGTVLADVAFAHAPAEHVIGPIGSSPSAPRLTIERKETQDLVLGGLKAVPARPVKAGTRFDAVYARVADPRDGQWTFRADGHFSRENSAAAGAAVVSTGTYAFEEYTLRLVLAGGEVQTLTVAAVGDTDEAGRPETLWCEGARLRRQ